MTREEFDKILIEEGYLNKFTRDALWATRPRDDLNELDLRRACKKTSDLRKRLDG